MTSQALASGQRSGQPSIVSAQLRSCDPASGVTLDSYVKCRRDSEVLHTFPEEEALDGRSGGRDAFAVRYRWLRSPDTAESGKGHVCHIHPDRPGAYYCGFWKSEYSLYGYPFSDACHCSLDCFQRHWKLQLTYWEKAQAAKQQSLEGAVLVTVASRAAAVALDRRLACRACFASGEFSSIMGVCVTPTPSLRAGGSAERRFAVQLPSSSSTVLPKTP